MLGQGKSDAPTYENRLERRPLATGEVSSSPVSRRFALVDVRKGWTD